MKIKTASAPEPPSLESLYRLDDIATFLTIGRRTLDRMIVSGRFPPPDVRIGKIPLWQRETIVAWVQKGRKPPSPRKAAS